MGLDLTSLAGGLVSALKEALDEQPDDCQRQPDEHKRQRATDNCCKHMYPRPHFSCTWRGRLVERKKSCAAARFHSAAIRPN
jgi:hypothetical protein